MIVHPRQKPQMRVKRSPTTLPPGVQGPVRGQVNFTFRWTGNAQRSPEEVRKPAVSLCWWGETGPGTLIELSAAAEQGLSYTITCGPKAFAKYLTDMQPLEIKVSLQHANDRHAINSQLDLCKLQSGDRVKARVPVTATCGGLLGTLAVAVSLAHSPLLSSFEVNEQRASTDGRMPLYPTSSRVITPLRQLNLQSHSMAPAAAASAAKASPAKLSFQHSMNQTLNKLPAPADAPQGIRALSHLLFNLLRDATNNPSRLQEVAQHMGPRSDGLPAVVHRLLARYDNHVQADAPIITALLGLKHETALPAQALLETIRELAEAVASLEQAQKQQIPIKLRRLAMVLTQKKLELQQAFAKSQGSNKQGLQPLELVAVLRKVDPAVTASELQALLWSLWQRAADELGRVLLQDLRAVIQEVAQADAYPGTDFKPRPAIKQLHATQLWSSHKSPPISRKRKASQTTKGVLPTVVPPSCSSCAEGVKANQPPGSAKRHKEPQAAPAQHSILSMPSTVAANQALAASLHGRSPPGNGPPAPVANMISTAQSIQVGGAPHVDLVQQAVLHISSILGSGQAADKLAANQPDPGAGHQAELTSDVLSIGQEGEEGGSASRLRQSPAALGVKQSASTLSALAARPEPDEAALILTSLDAEQQKLSASSGNEPVSDHKHPSAGSSDHLEQYTGSVTGTPSGQAVDTADQEGLLGKKEALSQLIARARKLKEQLDAHAQRSTSRHLPSASAVPTQLPSLPYPLGSKQSLPSMMPKPPGTTASRQLPESMLSLDLLQSLQQPIAALPNAISSYPAALVPTPATMLYPPQDLISHQTAVVPTDPTLVASTDPPPVVSALSAGLLGADGPGDEDRSSMSSDPAALVEDALLGELFFHDLDLAPHETAEHQSKGPGARLPTDVNVTKQTSDLQQSSSPVPAELAATNINECTEQAGIHVNRGTLAPSVKSSPTGSPVSSSVRLEVTVDKLDLPEVALWRWQLVLKAMQPGQPDVTLGPFQAAQLPATALLAGPADLRNHQDSPPSICILEVWQVKAGDSVAQRLAGIARVPVDMHSEGGQQHQLATGHFAVWDIFQGKAVGTIGLTVARLSGGDAVDDTQMLQQPSYEESRQTAPSSDVTSQLHPQPESPQVMHGRCEPIGTLEDAHLQDTAAIAAGAAIEVDQPVEPPEPVAAMLCVEIVRACGLLAAVNEAAIWLGGGSSLLGRAKQLGPHSFVQLSLFPASEQLEMVVPALQTSFQAQTFSPEFHFKRQLPVEIDARMVQALATQELLVEVWHHCPRSQMVATAMAQGGSASDPAIKFRDVFLGSGCLPLHSILNKPQGLAGWVGLKSRRGEPVGAVQLKACLSQLEGRHVPYPRSVFATVPALAALLPPEAPPQAHPFSHSGLNRQQARATVYIEEVILPQVEGGLHDRPRNALHHVSYRLPGSADTEQTAAKVATSAAASNSPGPNSPAGSFRVPLNHCGIHWVMADDSLAHALVSHPLQVSLHKQVGAPVTRRHSGKHGYTGLAAVPEHVGSADVDLSSLLMSRQADRDSDSRWTSGTYLLVHPASKHLGNARIRVKVLLELKPHSSGRVNSRQWHVPQVAPPAAKAAPNSPGTNDPPIPMAALRSPDANAVKVTMFPLASNVLKRQTPASDTRSEDLEEVGTADFATAAVAVQAASASEQALLVSNSHVLCNPAPAVQRPQPHPAAAGQPAQATNNRQSQPDHTRLPQETHTSSSHTSPTQSSPKHEQGQSHASVETDRQGQGGSSPSQSPSSQAQPDSSEDVVATSAQQPQHSTGLPVQAALLCIEEALHLALPNLSVDALHGRPSSTASSSGGPVLVQVAFRQAGQWESTPAVEASQSGGAAWQHTVAFPEALKDQGHTFEQLQVRWRSQENGDSGVVGSAQVDLSLLPILGQVSGWYNLFDDRDIAQGQLKVTFTSPAHQLPTYIMDRAAPHHRPHPASLASNSNQAASLFDNPERDTAAHASALRDPEEPMPRHRGAIVSVAAPKRRSSPVQDKAAAAERRQSSDSAGSQPEWSALHVSGSQQFDADATDADMDATDAQEPAAVLQTQMQQLSELSELLSQRLHFQDSAHQLQSSSSSSQNVSASVDRDCHAIEKPAPQQLGHEAPTASTSCGSANQLSESGSAHQAGNSSAQSVQLRKTQIEQGTRPPPDLKQMDLRHTAAQQQQSKVRVRTLLTEDSQARSQAGNEAGQQQGGLEMQLWGAASDDEAGAAGVGTDGFSSSNSSLAGDVAGLTFEGAVSEADSDDIQPTRVADQQGVDPPVPHLRTLSSLAHEDWMFGCQKEAAPEEELNTFPANSYACQPAPVSTSQQAPTKPAPSGAAASQQASTESASAGTATHEDLSQLTPAVALDTAPAQSQPKHRFSFSNALPLGPETRDTIPEEPSQPSSTLAPEPDPLQPQPKPRFSFSNALLPVPEASSSSARQQHHMNSQGEEERAWQAAADARQQLDASVADWLLHQTSQPEDWLAHWTGAPDPSLVSGGALLPSHASSAAAQDNSHLLSALPSSTVAAAAAQSRDDLVLGSTSSTANPSRSRMDGDAQQNTHTRSMPADQQAAAHGPVALSVTESVQHQRNLRTQSAHTAAVPRAGAPAEGQLQSAAGALQQPSIALQLPGGDGDWMFNITCRAINQTSRPQQQWPLAMTEAASSGSRATIIHAPAAVPFETNNSNDETTPTASGDPPNASPVPALPAPDSLGPIPSVSSAEAAPRRAHQKQQRSDLPVRAFSEVPHSVKEAVNRFEAWSQPLAPASAPQDHRPLPQHTQSPPQQPLSLLQHPHPLPQELALLPVSIPLTSGGLNTTPQLNLHPYPSRAAPSVTASVHSEPSHQQPGSYAAAARPERLPTWHQAAAAEEAQQTGIQPRPGLHQTRSPTTEARSSPALSLIDATLAAINASSESLPQIAQPLGSCSEPLIKSPASSSSLVSPGTVASEFQLQGPPSGGWGSGHTSSLPTSQLPQPPPPARLPQLRMSARPAFTDALADPALLQQPWLTSSGLESRPADRALDAGSGGPTALYAATSTQSHAGQHFADAQPQLTTAGAQQPKPGTAIRHVGSVISTHASQQHPGDRPLQQASQEGGKLGPSSSRWTAVNAYRQAREAALRAAPGHTGAAAVRLQQEPADVARGAGSSSRQHPNSLSEASAGLGSSGGTSASMTGNWRSWLVDNPCSAAP